MLFDKNKKILNSFTKIVQNNLFCSDYMAIPLATAQSQLDSAIAAYGIAVNSVSSSQSGGQINKQIQHQTLLNLQGAIEYWSKKVSDAENGYTGGTIVSEGAPL